MPALTPTTRQKVDELAQHFHKPRAAVLCHIMQWGLSREQTGPLDQGDAQGPMRHLFLFVVPNCISELRRQRLPRE